MMSFVWSEGIWRGRLHAALWFGVPAGALFGLIEFADSGSPARGVLGAIWFGLFFGAWMARWVWRSWRGAKDLPPGDRVAVVRAVRRGDGVGEPRLAPMVIDLADVVRQREDRDHRFGWVLWLPAGVTLILALHDSLAGSTLSAAVWWAVVGYWAAFLAWLPRRRARTLARAERAESLARRTLADRARV